MATSQVQAHVWPMGDHRIGVVPVEAWLDAAQAPESWRLEFQEEANADVFGEVPRVVVVTMRDDGAAVLDVDAKLHPGVGYTLLGTDVAGTAGDIDEDFDGALPRLLHTSPTVPPLVDLDAPWVPPGGVRRAPSGDYATSAELATVERMIWAAALTREGELDWDPGFGVALDWKRLRPSDLSATRRRLVELVRAVPHVVGVEVQVLFEGDEVYIAIEADTDFGRLEGRYAAR